MSTEKKTPQTRSQQLAQAAYDCIKKASENSGYEEYDRFAKSFPALIQSCGLIQSLLFAKKKNDIGNFLSDFLKVLKVTGSPNSIDTIRTLPCMDYIRASRFALEAATWLKRYSEALSKEG